MLVNSVSNFLNNGHKNINQNKNYQENSNVDKVNFLGGPNPEIVKNQLKILLTQDIWDVNLKVKMPETTLEKDVLLEILKNRLKLDRFTRLSNEKFQLKTQIGYLNSLLLNDPSNPMIPKLMKELQNRGNLSSVFKTLDKSIELEAKKNKPALDYFKTIEKMEDEYLEKKLIKPSKMEKFWYKIKGNNINKENKYSTEDLIGIISGEKGQINSESNKIINKSLSKKQFLSKVERQFEDFLRANVDIYSKDTSHYEDIVRAQKYILETNKEDINRFPGITKIFPKIYEGTKSKYLHKVDRLLDIDIYPIGEIWSDMNIVEAEMKRLGREIPLLRKQVINNLQNQQLIEELKIKEALLKEAKEDWIKGVKHSVNYEHMNRERMIAAGRVEEYDYLTSENKTLKRHKMAMKILAENNDTIPDDLWKNILEQ